MSYQPELPLVCQRWRNRRDSYRPARETINPDRYRVEPIAESQARAFICAHHYSGQYPATRFRAGLFHKGPTTREELVGVAVFSVPMNQAAIPAYTGRDSAHGVELGRLALLDKVEANGESFFVARALRLLREAIPSIEVLLSYSDPVPRVVHGRLTKRGHIGTVYTSSGFVFKGRSKARTLLIARRTGTVVSERAICKIRGQERGCEYALRQLRDLGAPPMSRAETPDGYVKRVVTDPALFTRFHHPGNFVFVAPVGDRRVRRNFQASSAAHGFPYPKQADAPCVIE